jgi:hypothetical protein
VAIEHADIRQPEDALAHVALQERPAREQRGKAGVALLELMTGELPPRVGEHITAHRPCCGQLGGEAGEQLVEYLSAPAMQAMHMTAVRHALALLPGWWQRIPLDNRLPACRTPTEPARSAARQNSRRKRSRDHSSRASADHSLAGKLRAAPACQNAHPICPAPNPSATRCMLL